MCRRNSINSWSGALRLMSFRSAISLSRVRQSSCEEMLSSRSTRSVSGEARDEERQCLWEFPFTMP